MPRRRRGRATNDGLAQRHSTWCFAVALTVFTLLVFAASTLVAQEDPPRTAWGDPDLQGVWDYRTITPMQRPPEQADREFLTDEEAASRDQAEADRLERIFNEKATRAEAGATGFGIGRGRDGEPGGYNQFWFDRGTSVAATKRTSLVIDPPDGRMPPLTPEEAERRAAIAEARQGVADHEPTPGGWVEDLGPAGLQARCITGFNAGPPMTPGSYNNNMQLFQTRDTVVILNEMVHNARVVPLDERAHGTLRQYSGDSRARWDGSTLVVTTTNFLRPTAFLRGRSSRDLQLTERFTRMSSDILLYQAVVDDPTTWTRPWTFEVPMRLSSEPLYEYACHEGNYGLYNVLAGAMLRDARDEGISRPVRTGDFWGGYQFMRDYDRGESFPEGWFVSGAGYLTNSIAIVGEVAGSRWSDTNPDFDLTANVDVTSYLGGLRVRRNVGPLSPFAQILGGGARAKATLTGFGTEVTESETALAIQPGGGVDVPLTDQVAARVTLDYRRIFFEGQGTNQIRVAVGIVVGLGGN